MPPSNKKSVLEAAFEFLFNRTFQCDWRNYLQPQYHVQVDGQNFYIDYVFIGQGRKIAIEVDGYGKIQDSTQKFHDFLARQNALVSQGFEVYRFGWHHVVSFEGLPARRYLERIFGHIIQPAPKAMPILQVTLETQQSSSVLEPVVPEPRLAKVPQNEHKVLQRFLLAGVIVLLFIGLGVLAFNLGYDSQKQETKQPPPVLVDPQVPKPLSPKPPPTVKKSQTNPPKPALGSGGGPLSFHPPTPRPVVPEPKQDSQDDGPEERSSDPQEPEAPPLQSDEEPPKSESPPFVPAPVDEVVAFNLTNGKFHRLNCTWAKRCLNCITIPLTEAVKRGGIPAKTCDPF